jgi:hypothetical protein
MKKNKFIFLALFGLLAFSSCGIFHKGCGCPTFGSVNINAPAKPAGALVS